MQTVTPPIRTARSEADRIRRVPPRPSRDFSVHPVAIRVVRTPLRICPLAARIDHQPGGVTGMSIAPPILRALDPVPDETVLVESTGFEAAARFPVNRVPPCRPRSRGNGLRGAVQTLRREHRPERGPIGIVGGQMPGGGLSSSQAAPAAHLLALDRHSLASGGAAPQLAPRSAGEDTRLIPPLRIEEGTDIGPGCAIGPGVCIERECRIRDGVVIQDAVTLRNAVIPDGRRSEGGAVL